MPFRYGLIFPPEAPPRQPWPPASKDALAGTTEPYTALGGGKPQSETSNSFYQLSIGALVAAAAQSRSARPGNLLKG